MSSTQADEPSLAQRVRSSTPVPAQQVIKGVTRAVGRATSGARLLPELIVAGAQRCGTTTLYRQLVAHPSVVRPLFHKGISYFDVGYHHGPAWYRGHFPVAATAALRTRRSGRPVTFDSSGYYLFHPLAPGRIARDLPDARVVVLVRDPVERAYSAWKSARAKGFETVGDFEAALDLEAERLAGEEDRIRRDPSYESHSHRHHAYVARGQYAGQVERFRALHGEDKVLVLDANVFFARPHEEYGRLQEWLGIPVVHVEEVAQHNARPGAPLPASVTRRLEAEFEASDAALAAVLGRDPSWRR